MTSVEAYLFLFFDSMMATLAFVPNTEMVYKAMQIFPGYSTIYMAIVASCGAMLGGSVNYVFGGILHALKQRVNNCEDSRQFKQLSKYSDLRLFWLLLLSFLPVIGVLLTIAAGFFRIRFFKLVFVVLVTRLFYYGVLHDLF